MVFDSGRRSHLKDDHDHFSEIRSVFFFFFFIVFYCFFIVFNSLVVSESVCVYHLKISRIFYLSKRILRTKIFLYLLANDVIVEMAFPCTHFLLFCFQQFLINDRYTFLFLRLTIIISFLFLGIVYKI